MLTQRNPSHKGDKIIMGLAVVAIASGVLGAATFTPVLAKSSPANANVMPVQGASFADMIEAVSPAVVAISTSGEAVVGVDMPEFNLPPGSPFEDFLKRFFQDRGAYNRGAPARKFHAQGSGFIIDPKGIVVTNHHVIKGADEITVITKDGDEYGAKLKGYDEKTDLAVLELDTDKELPFVEFGDSDSARVGDPVLAIGNPFGLGGTATSGIISARGRDINAGPLDDFLQIDAPINRGNSGGPLFDAQGKVVGVNTAIFSPNGGNVGIGFAIPSSMASSVIDQLIHNGHVQRGWLGVQIQALTMDLAESLGLDGDKGALVASVVEGSPAEKAGVRVGDVIVNFNGNPIDHMRDLRVTVGESKDSEPVVLSRAETPGKAKLGLALAELNDETRAQYRIDADTQGVLVVRVDPTGPAADKGIREGDVIKMVGNAAVSQPKEVVTEVNKASEAKRKSVLLLVERNGSDRFVAVGIA